MIFGQPLTSALLWRKARRILTKHGEIRLRRPKPVEFWFYVPATSPDSLIARWTLMSSEALQWLINMPHSFLSMGLMRQRQDFLRLPMKLLTFGSGKQEYPILRERMPTAIRLKHIATMLPPKLF